MKRLILTGLEPFSREEKENLVFLGPWCFLGREDAETWWHETEFPPLYGGGRGIKEASDSTAAFGQRLLPRLAAAMNGLHGRSYSVDFWSLLLSTWLVSAVQVLYDRYLRLMRLVETGEAFRVWVTPDGGRLKVGCTGDFKGIGFERAANHHLLSQILREIRPPGWSLEEDARMLAMAEHPYCLGASVSPFRLYVLRTAKRAASRFFSVLLARWCGIYVEGVYGIGMGELAALSWRVGKGRGKSHAAGGRENLRLAALPVSPENGRGSLPEIDPAGVASDEFERLAVSLLPQWMPASFLAEFPSFERRARLFLRCLGGGVRHLVVGPAVMGGLDQLKYVAGLHKESGGRLIGSQHGGNYGNALALPSADLEYRHSDAFLTWGWTAHGNYPVKAVPLSSPLLSKWAKRRESPDGRMILVMTRTTLLLYRLDSFPQAESCSLYREAKMEFIRGLREAVRRSLWVRPYLTEHGSLPERSYIRRHFPDLRFLSGELYSQIVRSRLTVLDHPTTSLNLALAANVPTLLFWDREWWPVCAEAEPYFDRLEEAGIFHRTPDLAARWANEIWGDVEGWWEGREVQEAREAFCRQFARASKDWLEEWADFLKDAKRGREFPGASLSEEGILNPARLEPLGKPNV